MATKTDLIVAKFNISFQSATLLYGLTSDDWPAWLCGLVSAMLTFGCLVLWFLTRPDVPRETK